MYFEFARHKVILLLSLALVLGAASAPLALVKHTDSAFAHAIIGAVRRAKADAQYVFIHKAPREAYYSLLAAVSTANYAASTAASDRNAGVAKNVPVLVYHGEGDAPTNPPTAAFIRHMHALHDAGWRTITMKEFRAFMKGEASVPDKSFLLTFDDGRRDAFYETDPVLKDLGYTAVMFVITGFSLPDGSGRPIQDFYLSKTELAYMLESGRWELESHGDQDHRFYEVPAKGATKEDPAFLPGKHFLSNRFWVPEEERIETTEEFSTRIREDLATSKRILEETFNIDVHGFAYPLNDFGQDAVNNPQAIALIDRAVPQIYTFAFYQTWAGDGDSANYPDPDAYFIKRIEPTEKWSSEDLLAVLSGARPKALPYEAETFGADWNTNWGIVLRGDALTLAANNETTGAAAFLDGTGGWEDYRVRASTAVRSGTFSIIARYTGNDAPYAVCAFSDDRIYLEQHTGTELTKLASSPYNPPAAPGTRTVSMTVSGDTASCSAYGIAVSANVSGIPTRGGVGATVWTPSTGSAEVALTRLSVEPY